MAAVDVLRPLSSLDRRPNADDRPQKVRRQAEAPRASSKRRANDENGPSPAPAKSKRAGNAAPAAPLAPIDINVNNGRGTGLDAASCQFGAPIRPLDHEDDFDSLARFSAAAYRNYAKAQLARTRDEIYGDAKHSVRGLNGDARFARLKADLDGFEDKPIQLQRLMHFAAFEVEGPLIWGEEYGECPRGGH